MVRDHPAVHHHRGRDRGGVRRHALPGHQRRGHPARRRPALRGGGDDARCLPLHRVPAGHAAADRARHRGRRGAGLGPGARRVRRDHHVRRQLPRPDPDHAARGLSRPPERPRGRHLPQPGPAGRVDRGAGRPQGPLDDNTTNPHPATEEAADSPGPSVTPSHAPAPPAAPDGAQSPPGPPAPGDKSRTGGADGNPLRPKAAGTPPRTRTRARTRPPASTPISSSTAPPSAWT